MRISSASGFLVAAAFAIAGTACLCHAAALEALPPYLAFKSFRPHPMACTASKPLFVR